MADIDLSKTLGAQLPDQAVRWRVRDLLLYATGVGAQPNELSYIYELSPRFRPLPTYPLVLALKGDDDEVNLFAERVSGRSALPGFPKLDPNTIVHGEQSLRILRPLPATASGPGWKLRRRISGVHDKGKGKALILDTEATLVSPSDEVYAVMVGATFYRGGGLGTGFDKSLPSPDAIPSGAGPSIKPSGQPQYELRETVLPAQAAIYRLSGDYNPLHIDPSIGARTGLGGVILHGLCSYGIATPALLKAHDTHDGEPAHESGVELEYISARFTAPVRLGDTLVTRVWKDGERGEGWCAFEQVVLRPGSEGTAVAAGIGKGSPPISLRGVAKVRAGRAAVQPSKL